MWEIDNALQLLSVVRSVALGILFSLIYDVLRALRRVKSYGEAAVFIQDIVYSVTIAFITYTFLLSVTNGEVRAFVIISIALGFLVSRFTVSYLFFKACVFIISKLDYIIKVISQSVYRWFDRLVCGCAEIYKKSVKYIKKHLKKAKGLLYTKK